MDEETPQSDPANDSSVSSSELASAITCTSSILCSESSVITPLERLSSCENRAIECGDMDWPEPPVSVNNCSLPTPTSSSQNTGYHKEQAIDAQSFDSKSNVDSTIRFESHNDELGDGLFSCDSLPHSLMSTSNTAVTCAAEAACSSGALAESSGGIPAVLSSSASDRIPSYVSDANELFATTNVTMNPIISSLSSGLSLPRSSLQAEASGSSSNSNSSGFTLPPTNHPSEVSGLSSNSNSSGCTLPPTNFSADISGSSSNSNSSGFTLPPTSLPSDVPGPSSNSNSSGFVPPPTSLPSEVSISEPSSAHDLITSSSYERSTDASFSCTCSTAGNLAGKSDRDEKESMCTCGSRDEREDAGASASEEDSVRRSQPDLTAVPVRSSLKRRLADSDGTEARASKRARGRNIQFDNVTVIYFPRAQGFTCVPSQGGSTLGMAKQHSHSERYSLGEYALLKREAQRRLLTKLRARQKHSVQVVSTSSEDSDAASELSDLSDSEPDVDSCFFLRPMLTRQRRLMLRSSGVRKIEPAEREECRVIRSSREFCGCVCRVVCLPETCLCASSNIKCQVDRQNFPCGCTREGCQNPNGRIEFNPARVRKHYVETILREQQFGHWSDPPASLANGGEWHAGSLFPYPLQQEDFSSSCSENSDDTGSCDSGETGTDSCTPSSSVPPNHPPSLSATQQHSHYSQFSFDGGLQTFQTDLTPGTSWSSQIAGFNPGHYGPRVYDASYSAGYQHTYAPQYSSSQLSPAHHYTQSDVCQTLPAVKAVPSEDSGVDVDIGATCGNLETPRSGVTGGDDARSNEENVLEKQEDNSTPAADESIGELIKKSMVESVSA